VLDTAAERARDLERRADAALHAAHVEERLVDRECLDHRSGVVEDAKDGFRRFGVRLEPGRHDDRLRTQLTRASLAHRSAHPVRLCLV